MGRRCAVSTRIAIALTVGGAAPAPLAGCSCGGGEEAADAGPDEDGGLAADAGAAADANTPLIWVDFSVAGCEDGGASAAGGPDGGPGEDAGPSGQQCRGAAPLRLEFVPIAPAPVDLYEWSFGDGGEPDRRPAPAHVYSSPGVYDVSLFAQGPGGTAAVTREALVVVTPGPLGSACSGDAQCASGTCICGAEGCAGLESGFCSQPCGGAECAEGVCADLAPSAPPDPAPWQAQLCVADCGDQGCPDGLVCRELRGAGGGWLPGCFAPGLVGDVGDACAGDSGAPQDALCASGICLAEGLRGLCSAPCSDQPCPSSAACATFNGGGRAPSCVARCDADTLCDGDPWLACEPPGGAGPGGFEVDEEASPGGYCAPRACEVDEECPLGQCEAGYCSSLP